MRQIGLIFLLLFIVYEDVVLSQQSVDLKSFRDHISKILESELDRETAVWRNESGTNLSKLEVDDVPGTFDRIYKLYSTVWSGFLNIILRMIKIKTFPNGPTTIKNLKTIVLEVDSKYETLCQYLNYSRNYRMAEIEWFIRFETSETTVTLFHKMHKVIYPDESDIQNNLFHAINNDTTDMFKVICDSPVSTQLELFELYKIIARTRIRGRVLFHVFEKAHQMLQIKFFESRWIADFNSNYSLWNKSHWHSIKTAVFAAPRDICIRNPKQHQRYKTFIELERTFQMIIQNEEYLNGDSCKETCNDLTYRTVPAYCSGKITNCISTDDLSNGGRKPVDICWGSNPSRGFEWFQLTDNDVFGHKSSCKTDQIRGWMKFPYECDYCLCFCTPSFEDSAAIQTISLRSQESDIDNNMVVTGVKFELKNHMIHIRIKEGKLLPAGHILKKNETWKPLEDIIRKSDGHFYINYNNDEWRFANMIQYIQISPGQNELNLDDIKVPKGHVVTGVRFAFKGKFQWGQPMPLGLEVRATPFDFITGQLTLSNVIDTLWINNTNAFHGEATPTLTDNPLSSPSDAFVRNVKNVNFQVSNLEDDAGQSTIPFFDAQPVEIDRGFALDGIGLSLKGRGAPSGFLTLKISTIDISNYINEL